MCLPAAVSDLVKLLSDENVDLQTNTLKLINALLTATSGTEETGRRFGMFAKLGVERTVNKFAPGQVRIGRRWRRDVCARMGVGYWLGT